MYYKNKFNQFGIILILFFLSSPLYYSQIKKLHHIAPPNGIIGEDLIISVSLIEIEDPIKAKLYYRLPDSESFLEIDFVNTGFNWKATIPGFGLTEKGIEYAIAFEFSQNRLISYPRVDPFNNPVFLQVFPPKKKLEDSAFGKLPMAQVLILSPEPNTIVKQNELLIAASLFNADQLDPSSVKLLLDGKDMSSEMTFEDGILILDPGPISMGTHSVQINMKDIDLQDMAPFKWSFIVGKKRQEVLPVFKYDGRLNSRLSTEQVSETKLNIAEVNGDFSFDLQWAKLNTNLRFTSRESPYTQPHNRFGTQLLIGSFLNLRIGDFYPQFNQFTIDGKRVRGWGLKLDFKRLQFEFINGELNRAVNESGHINGGYQLIKDLITTNDDGSKTYFLDRTGFAFKRKIFGLKLNANLLSNIKMGFHFMKMRDDTSSVKHILDKSLFSIDSSIPGIDPGNYTLDEFNNKLLNQGDKLNNPSTNWMGQKPLDNLLLGFNVGTAFDNKRLKLDFNWDMSLFNRDIWDGAMSRAALDTIADDSLDGWIGVQYDSLGNEISSSSKIDTGAIFFDPIKFQDIFIINSSMTPLVPFDINTLTSNPLATLINMPSSAFNIRLRGNYGGNSILVEYRQIGPEFISLGNPFLRRNSRQFTLSDRISLMNRKLFLNIGFKHLDNKILRTTANPLNTNTFFMNFTFLPGPGMPTFVINYQSIGKNNEKSQLDSIGSKTVDLREDSKASTNMMALTMPFSSGNIKQNIVLSLGGVTNLDNLSNKRSSAYLFPKTDSKTISINLSSIFPSELKTVTQFSQTKLDIPSMSENKLVKTLYTWTNFSISANYRLLNNRMLARGAISLMDSRSKINSQLLGIRAGADYQIQTNLSATLVGYIRVYSVPSQKFVETNSSGIVVTLNYNF